MRLVIGSMRTGMGRFMLPSMRFLTMIGVSIVAAIVAATVTIKVRKMTVNRYA